jgi:beta-lactamase class A
MFDHAQRRFAGAAIGSCSSGPAVADCRERGTGKTATRAIRERIAGFPGTVSLFAKNLDTGDTLGFHLSGPVRTACTIKAPIMLAVFDAVARGQAKWDEPLTLTAQEKVAGSRVLGVEFSGDQMLLRDVLHLMIMRSDNTVTGLAGPRTPIAGMAGCRGAASRKQCRKAAAVGRAQGTPIGRKLTARPA